MSFPVYLDEDSSGRALTDALRQRGVDVVRAVDLGMRGESDPEHLRVATEHQRVLLTANRGHFAALHREWIETSRQHAGIIVIVQQDQIGRVIAGIMAIQHNRTQAGMRNSIEWLSAWLDR